MSYRIGRGEQGVLTVEPYKSELLPLWRFRTPALAKKSAADLYGAFLRYRRARDFAGMDMARKFLQMGYTRSRRYARHRDGRKYAPDGSERPLDPDPQKQRSAEHFQAALAKVRADKTYSAMKGAYLARRAHRR